MLTFLLFYFGVGAIVGLLVVFFSDSLDLTIYNTQTKNFLAAVVGWPACVLIGILCVAFYYKGRNEQTRQRIQQTNSRHFVINDSADYMFYSRAAVFRRAAILETSNSLAIPPGTQSTAAVENEYATRRAQRHT